MVPQEQGPADDHVVVDKLSVENDTRSPIIHTEYGVEVHRVKLSVLDPFENVGTWLCGEGYEKLLPCAKVSYKAHNLRQFELIPIFSTTGYSCVNKAYFKPETAKPIVTRPYFAGLTSLVHVRYVSGI